MAHVYFTRETRAFFGVGEEFDDFFSDIYQSCGCHQMQEFAELFAILLPTIEREDRLYYDSFYHKILRLCCWVICFPSLTISYYPRNG